MPDTLPGPASAAAQAHRRGGGAIAIGHWLNHLRHLVRPRALPPMRLALERDTASRAARVGGVARDRLGHRFRPSRPEMHALVVRPGGRVRWRRMPTPPSPGPLAATVRPLAIATCDMDRPIGLGATPFALPLHLGHECVGEVLRVGSDVEGFRPGDRAIVPFQISCGGCSPCRVGHTGNCTAVPPISMYGFGLAGGLWGGAIADELAVPFADAMLVPLPDGIAPEAAASIADNVSDGYRHVGPHLPRLIEEGRGDEVLIIGAISPRHLFTASVSLYAGLVARALGVRRVILADTRSWVQAQAESLGLEATSPQELGGTPTAALVVDASATAKGFRLAVEHTAPDGICSSVGSLHANASLPFSTMFVRNISIHVGRTQARSVIPQVLELVESGRLRPQDVTTVLAPIDEAVAAIEAHMRGESTKTVLTAAD
jgi:alcohol dehydrogenase